MSLSSRWERLSRSPAFSGYAMISPTALYALLLLAAPLATVVYLSFQTDGPGVREVIHQFTIGNYTAAWTDPIYRSIMFRSLFVSTMVTIATVVTAFPVAYFVSFHVASNKKSLWLFMITIPFWTSYLVRVFLWKVILGYNGVINSGLKSIGLIDQPLTWINVNIGAIVMTLAHAYAPFAILPIFVALEKIDRSLLEAGRDLGESAMMTFKRVTLPLAMPGVVAAVLIVFIPTVGDYVTPDIIGGGKLPLIANVIQKQLLAIDNMPLGSAVAVSAMLIVGVIAAGFVLANARFLKVKK
ncbi:MAG: ABC transporter permease [Paracoccaceae bacterium]|jgi:spermidine/putrescine transport system permease protein